MKVPLRCLICLVPKEVGVGVGVGGVINNIVAKFLNSHIAHNPFLAANLTNKFSSYISEKDDHFLAAQKVDLALEWGWADLGNLYLQFPHL